MVSFRKNNKTGKSQRYRYDLPSATDQQTSDAQLSAESDAPLKAALLESEISHEDDPVYELVVEEKNTTTEETESVAATAETLVDQVEKLCHEYEAINQQLEKSLIAANELNQHLEKSKKLATISYAAIGIAGFALIMAIVTIAVSFSIQRDITDLKDKTALLAGQLASAKKDSALTIKATQGRIDLLSDKVDKVFEVDNLDAVLQVTRDLKKQIHSLASKNLNLMNAQNQISNETKKPNKITPSNLKSDSETSQQNSAESIKRTDNEKKSQTGNLATANASENNESDAHWLVTFGKFDDKIPAKEFATKLKKAGISVALIQVKGKKPPKYRVVSKAFKSKQQAQNHLEHVEKTLGLHSAVLSKTK